MTNHIHLLVAAEAPAKLPDIIRDFKKHTNKKIIQLVKDEPESRRDWMLYRFEYNAKYNNRIEKYKVWQDGNMAKQIITSEFMKQKLDYIHNNPVEEMVVAEAQEYLFSSARDYAGEKGLIDVELVF